MNAYDTAQRRAHSLSLSLSVYLSIYLSIFHSLSRKQAGEALGRELQDPGGDRWCWTRSSKRAWARTPRPRPATWRTGRRKTLTCCSAPLRRNTSPSRTTSARPCQLKMVRRRALRGRTATTKRRTERCKPEEARHPVLAGCRSTPFRRGSCTGAGRTGHPPGTVRGVRTPRAATTRRGTRRGGGKKS